MPSCTPRTRSRSDQYRPDGLLSGSTPGEGTVTTIDDTSSPHPLRALCQCGSAVGVITEKGAQDVVNCAECGAYLYNAPRHETGKAVRTVTSRAGIKPKVRHAVLTRCGHRCVECGSDGPLHVDHLIPIDAVERYGVDADIVADELNLIALCDECNLGKGHQLPDVLLIAKVIRVWRIARESGRVV